MPADDPRLAALARRVRARVGGSGLSATGRSHAHTYVAPISRSGHCRRPAGRGARLSRRLAGAQQLDARQAGCSIAAITISASNMPPAFHRRGRTPGLCARADQRHARHAGAGIGRRCRMVARHAHDGRADTLQHRGCALDPAPITAAGSGARSRCNQTRAGGRRRAGGPGADRRAGRGSALGHVPAQRAEVEFRGWRRTRRPPEAPMNRRRSQVQIEHTASVATGTARRNRRRCQRHHPGTAGAVIHLPTLLQFVLDDVPLIVENACCVDRELGHLLTRDSRQRRIHGRALASPGAAHVLDRRPWETGRRAVPRHQRRRSMPSRPSSSPATLQSGLPGLAVLAGGLWFAAMPAHIERWRGFSTHRCAVRHHGAALPVADRRARIAAELAGVLALAAFAAALLSKEAAAGWIAVIAAAECGERARFRPTPEIARWLAPYAATPCCGSWRTRCSRGPRRCPHTWTQRCARGVSRRAG